VPAPLAAPVLTNFSAPAEGAKASLSRASLQISKMDFTVNSIIDKINRGKVNLRPSYQREYVWTTRTASRLVESLLLNVPIPTMFFHETERGNMEVVDGKQRLTSIWAFMMEEFPDGTPFKLTGLEVYEELNGKTFSDLSETQQETIKDYPLNVHTISRQSQPDFVFEVFERLNMGATQLNEQELRNCIYQGAYTELLGGLARNAHLLRIYKSASPHLRMRDRELILRFFAMLRTGPEGFASPVKTWLNEEIRAHRELAPDAAARMADVFERAIGLAWRIFGDCAFRPVREGAAAARAAARAAGGAGASAAVDAAACFESGEVNVALWDTVLYSLAQYDPGALLARKGAVLDAFVGLAGDPKFRRLLVSQPKAVAARAEAWAKVLERVLDAPPLPGDGEGDGAEAAFVAGAGGAAAEARAEDAESWAGLD
jgi:hypothetical protein